MALPSLEALLGTQVPIVVCARPWAKDLLNGYPLAGFIEMKGRWREDRAAVNAYRKRAQHAHPRGLLLPDSLSSAMVFKFAGIPSAGYRDEGRSLILRWPLGKPPSDLHAVESWYHITAHALKRWNYAAPPLSSRRDLVASLPGLITTLPDEEQLNEVFKRIEDVLAQLAQHPPKLESA